MHHDAAIIERLKAGERDLAAAAGVAVFAWVPDGGDSVDVEFAEDAPVGAPA